MKFIFAFAVALLPVVCLAQTRIIGGKEVDPARYPFVVKINQVHSQYPFFCSASLVGPRVALFAAHCFYNDGSGQGLLLVENEWVPMKVVLSPLWESRFHDVAVGILESPIHLRAYSAVYYRPVSMGAALTVMGYGCEKVGSTPDGILRRGGFSMKGYFEHNPLMMMASGLSLTCSGDSGGPTFIHGSRLQVGVTSGADQSVSYLSRLDTEESVNFLESIGESYQVVICGITDQCW